MGEHYASYVPHSYSRKCNKFHQPPSYPSLVQPTACRASALVVFTATHLPLSSIHKIIANYQIGGYSNLVKEKLYCCYCCYTVTKLNVDTLMRIPSTLWLTT